MPSKWCALAALFPALAHAAEFRVAAKGDGSTVATAAIQRAIDAAAKTKGTVVFSPGVYRTGALFLKSGITFRVDDG
ncbi:MAG: glycoside hydrolase family 28 protein, partial [Acidobacteriota bacterium]|nr:glycoside hydrolase family 28 protein [Acidobacteriota bacterium]